MNETEHTLSAETCRALLREIEPTSTFTADYWIGQLLWEEGRINAVLDWEEAGYGDPAYDVAYGRLFLWLDEGPAIADEFRKTYEAEVGYPVVNLSFWEYAVTPRVMHNPAMELDHRQRLRDFIAHIQINHSYACSS